MTNFIDEGEEEVLKGVSKLREELEIERSRNNGLVQQVEVMKMKHSIDDSDHDEHTELRKKIVVLENKLSTYINKSNMQRGGEEAMLSRLRTLLEKSEAARHQAEYNLVLEKKTNRELEEDFGEREKCMNEEITKYKGTMKEVQQRAREWESAVELTQKAADMEKGNMSMQNEKLKALLEEKEGVIQFMTYEFEQHKAEIERLVSELRVTQSAEEKRRKSCEQQQTMIGKQKDMLKQLTLKDAVREQKEMKYKEDMRLKREEVKELRAVLVQEREYNVQTNHSVSRLQEMKSLQDTQVKLLKEKLAEASSSIATVASERDEVLTMREEGEERERQLMFEMEEIKKASTISEQMLNEQLKDQQHHITDLSSELKHHQNICTELSNELGVLQTGMEQIEAQYGQSVQELERVYCQHYKVEKNNIPVPLFMVNTLAQKLLDCQNIENKLEGEIAGLNREIERSKYSAELKRNAMLTRTEAIASLNKQVSEIAALLEDCREDLKSSRNSVSVLQQQITDLATLLGTEQEKVMTLLKDKKEAIEESHAQHKHKCEALQGILSVLGTAGSQGLEWPELCRGALAAGHTLVEDKTNLSQSLQNAREEVSQCHQAMETLSNNTHTLRAEFTAKQVAGDTAHNEHLQQLESHYQRMIDAVNNRLQTTEDSTIDTNNKLAVLYTDNEGLQDKLGKLRDQSHVTSKKLVKYSSTIELLATSLYTKNQQYGELGFKYSLLKTQSTLQSIERSEIRALSSALAEETPRHSPIDRFRVCVIAVLAGNRLQTLHRTPGLSKEQLDLLLNSEVMSTDRLVRVLNSSTPDVPRFEGSLLQRIARAPIPFQKKPVQKIRSFVLALTQRLHSAELERRSLVTKACHWEHEASGLKGAYKQTLELGKKVEELEGKAFKTVPLDKHEELMREVADVMGREECLREEAHNLRQQLKRLEDSYEHTSSLLKDKSNTLDEAIKELAENKVQSRQLEQNHRATTRRVENLESDKKSILDQLTTVQKCVAARTKERDTLLNHMTRVKTCLEERKCQISSGDLHNEVRMSLNNDENTSEIKQVQTICKLYEDILKLSKRRILCLERDVESFKDHTQSLKGELNAACQRLVLEEFPEGKALVGLDEECNESFVPLVQCEASELGARLGKNFAELITN